MTTYKSVMGYKDMKTIEVYYGEDYRFKGISWGYCLIKLKLVNIMSFFSRNHATVL